MDLSQQSFVSFFMELKRRRADAGHPPSHATMLGGVDRDAQTYGALIHDEGGTFYSRDSWRGRGDEPNEIHPVIEFMNGISRWHAEGGLMNALAHSGYRGGRCVIMVDRRLCANCHKRAELEQNGVVNAARALNIAELFAVEYLPYGPPSFRKHVWTPADLVMQETREMPDWARDMIARASITA